MPRAPNTPTVPSVPFRHGEQDEDGDSAGDGEDDRAQAGEPRHSPRPEMQSTSAIVVNAP